jgi:nucleotide-binding universal stress UspA family protein
MSVVMLAVKPDSDGSALARLAQAYVTPPATVEVVSLVRVGNEGNELTRLAEVEAALEPTIDALESAGLEVRTHVSVVVPGTDGQSLVLRAQEIGADLAIFGLGGKSRVGKALMGSDAQRLLIGLRCPALTVRLDRTNAGPGE